MRFPTVVRQPLTSAGPGRTEAPCRHFRLRRLFPFCRNWKTAVAISFLSGFLSGCLRFTPARVARGKSRCSKPKRCSVSHPSETAQTSA